jgi:hypothetical protein
MAEVYQGRMVADGNGNLLADEGDRAGYPVAYEDGQYIFIGPGEPSHNARHEENVLEMVATQDVDESLPGYAGTPDNPTEGAEHHWDAAPSPLEPDAVSAKGAGHTDAYTKEGN